MVGDGLLIDLTNAAQRFCEASGRMSRARALPPIETQIEKGMARAFKLQGKIFAQQFTTLHDDWPVLESYFNVQRFTRLCEAIDEGALDALFEDGELETLELMTDTLTTGAQAGLAAGSKALMATLDTAVSFNLKNPKAQAYVDEHGAKLVSSINETTRGDIKGLVQRAVDDGWSYGRTAEAIQQRYNEFAIGKPQEHIDSRAHLVAVTEAGQAYEFGGFAVTEELTSAGLALEKYWSTMQDDRVSEECRLNEADGWIAVDQAHSSGDMHPLRFPGCRCNELYQVV